MTNSPHTASAPTAGHPVTPPATLADALADRTTLPMPSHEEEHWRYGRIDALDPSAFAPAAGDGPAPATPDHGVDIGPTATTVVLVDGRPVSTSGSVPGLTVSATAKVPAEVRGAAADALDQLHDALGPATVVIEVAPGAVITEPVLVVSWVSTEGVAAFPHVVVRAGDDSEVTVHVHHGSADVFALAVPTVEVIAGRAARVRVLELQDVGHQVWVLARQASRVDADATFVTGLVALGGDYARVAVDSALIGKGASGELLALSFGEGDQLHDLRTVERHVAPHTTSRMLVKGAVEDRSKAVYTGLIHIGKDARGSVAVQTNRNVKLSSGAWAESVPNLEIENNDVKCSHASAIGPVDEEQLFYLESRGVPTSVAERLVVLGFFEEVLERLPVPGAAEGTRAELDAKFARRAD